MREAVPRMRLAGYVLGQHPHASGPSEGAGARAAANAPTSGSASSPWAASGRGHALIGASCRTEDRPRQGLPELRLVAGGRPRIDSLSSARRPDGEVHAFVPDSIAIERPATSLWCRAA